MYAIKENIVDVDKAKMVPVVCGRPQCNDKDYFYNDFLKYRPTPEQLFPKGYPPENPENPGYFVTPVNIYNTSPNSRICCRCGRTFHIENTNYSDTDRNKENIDPKGDVYKPKTIPVLGPYLELQKHPQFKDADFIYNEFSKYLLTPEQLSLNDYPLENLDNPEHIFTRMKTYHPSATTRICSRCGRTFHIVNNIYSSDTKCIFHSERKDKDNKYGCCGKTGSEKGCTFGINHVNPALPLDDLIFKKTDLMKQVKADQQRKIFGLDCEMVYTTLGFEVAKVTLVDVQGKPVYDTLVRPQYKVTDHNTYYSGIREKDLQDVKVTLDDVQAFLLKNITKDTILVGHALQNDLKCLRLIHKNVVDTQVVFRNPRDNRRKKLKTLASVFLNQEIQDGKNRHCSVEDARTCMELMLKKIYNSLEVPQENYLNIPSNIHNIESFIRPTNVVFIGTQGCPFYPPNSDTNMVFPRICHYPKNSTPPFPFQWNENQHILLRPPLYIESRFPILNESGIPDYSQNVFNY